MENSSKKYEDIINLPRPISSTRAKMSMHDRAAQFSPFAALTGYDDSIKEASRHIEAKPLLEDGMIEKLNEMCREIMENHYGDCVEISYFVPDGLKKQGGSIQHFTGYVKQILPEKRCLICCDGPTILFSNLLQIEIQNESR